MKLYVNELFSFKGDVLAEGHNTMHYSNTLLLIVLNECPLICVCGCGCEHLSTSGSGRHQMQHGSNTALLPSNCYHSPSVLLLRCCSADQPPRARSIEALSQTHTHGAERTHKDTYIVYFYLIFAVRLNGGFLYRRKWCLIL